MKKTKKTRIFFTSDLWLERANILDLYKRPFSSLEKMNEKLIENWNTTVNDTDIVFVLGNFIYDSINARNILTELHGTKILMLTEMDKNVLRADTIHVEELTRVVDILEIGSICEDNNYISMYNNAFGFLTSEEIWNSITGITDMLCPNVIILKNSIIELPKLNLVISLYPLLDWNGKEYGSINIHGGKLENPNDIAKDKRLNVRTDLWDFTPIELTEITTLIEQFKKTDI